MDQLLYVQEWYANPIEKLTSLIFTGQASEVMRREVRLVIIERFVVGDGRSKSSEENLKNKLVCVGVNGSGDERTGLSFR